MKKLNKNKFEGTEIYSPQKIKLKIIETSIADETKLDGFFKAEVYGIYTEVVIPSKNKFKKIQKILFKDYTYLEIKNKVEKILNFKIEGDIFFVEDKILQKIKGKTVVAGKITKEGFLIEKNSILKNTILSVIVSEVLP